MSATDALRRARRPGACAIIRPVSAARPPSSAPLRLLATQDARRYDDVVRSMPVTSALQGWGYGEARRVLGQTPLRYLILQGDDVVGAVQLIRKRLLPGFTTLYARAARPSRPWTCCPPSRRPSGAPRGPATPS